MNNTINSVNENSKVSGEYMGKVFSGTVKSVRPHTANWNITIVFINFDSPIAIWDDKDIRTGICMEVTADGKTRDGGSYVKVM